MKTITKITKSNHRDDHKKSNLQKKILVFGLLIPFLSKLINNFSPFIILYLSLFFLSSVLKHSNINKCEVTSSNKMWTGFMGSQKRHSWRWAILICEQYKKYDQHWDFRHGTFFATTCVASNIFLLCKKNPLQGLRSDKKKYHLKTKAKTSPMCPQLLPCLCLRQLEELVRQVDLSANPSLASLGHPTVKTMPAGKPE